jgi:Protein of unknown function DUF45
VERALPEELIARLNRDGASIAARFGLRYRAIEAERPRVKRRYGVCYADGTIRIRLRHAATGKPLKYSSLVNTLCHELAHLKHFNHGLRFQHFYRQILEHARAVRIYLPGPELVQRIAPPAARSAAPPLDPARRRGLRTRVQPAHTSPPAQHPPRRPLQLTLFEVDLG